MQAPSCKACVIQSSDSTMTLQIEVNNYPSFTKYTIGNDNQRVIIVRHVVNEHNSYDLLSHQVKYTPTADYHEASFQFSNVDDPVLILKKVRDVYHPQRKRYVRKYDDSLRVIMDLVAISNTLETTDPYLLNIFQRRWDMWNDDLYDMVGISTQPHMHNPRNFSDIDIDFY